MRWKWNCLISVSDESVTDRGLGLEEYAVDAKNKEKYNQKPLSGLEKTKLFQVRFYLIPNDTLHGFVMVPGGDGPLMTTS